MHHPVRRSKNHDGKYDRETGGDAQGDHQQLFDAVRVFRAPVLGCQDQHGGIHADHDHLEDRLGLISNVYAGDCGLPQRPHHDIIGKPHQECDQVLQYHRYGQYKKMFEKAFFRLRQTSVAHFLSFLNRYRSHP